MSKGSENQFLLAMVNNPPVNTEWSSPPNNNNWFCCELYMWLCVSHKPVNGKTKIIAKTKDRSFLQKLPFNKDSSFPLPTSYSFPLSTNKIYGLILLDNGMAMELHRADAGSRYDCVQVYKTLEIGMSLQLYRGINDSKLVVIDKDGNRIKEFSLIWPSSK